MHLPSEIERDLTALGLAPGDLVMVHASMRAVGPVLGGPDTVVEALLRTVGPDGTVAMYMDWEDAAQGWTRDDRYRQPPAAWLGEWPPYDPATARASRDHGILAEFFRTRPGVERSGNPGASMAAVGARAAWLCADHPLDYGYGPGSPFAKVVEAGGKVLLLGSPLENVTLLHHAEHVARLEGKRVIRFRERLLRDGRPVWVDVEEFDTSNPVVAGAPDDYFGTLVREYVDAGRARSGPVGGAESHLFDAADLHRFAVAWMEARWGPGGRESAADGPPSGRVSTG